ncbi:MAG TPA: class I SAM-dependent methyltransferase [Spirochaetota bacterium]
MDYWDERYSKEGHIWGTVPSITVSKADDVFRAGGCRDLLIPGCGYGRNANFFEKKGYSVTGMDSSPVAIDMARKFNPRITYMTGSITDTNVPKRSFDGIYAFNIFHYFLANERKLFIKRIFEILRPGGLAFLTMFSEEEKDYRSGPEVEPHTYESSPNHFKHFFNRDDLLNHFALHRVIEDGLIEEAETHGDEGHHIHILRYIIVRE